MTHRRAANWGGDIVSLGTAALEAGDKAARTGITPLYPTLSGIRPVPVERRTCLLLAARRPKGHLWELVLVRDNRRNQTPLSLSDAAIGPIESFFLAGSFLRLGFAAMKERAKARFYG